MKNKLIASLSALIAGLVVGLATLVITNDEATGTTEAPLTVNSFLDSDPDDGVWAERDFQAFSWSEIRNTSFFTQRWEPTKEVLPNDYIPVENNVRVLVPVRSVNRDSRITSSFEVLDSDEVCGVWANVYGFAFGETALEAEQTGLVTSEVNIFDGIELIWMIVDLLPTEPRNCTVETIMNRFRPIVEILEAPYELWLGDNPLLDQNETN